MEAVLTIFVGNVFVIFADTIFITFIISTHSITEVSALLFKHLLFSQIHVVVLQL